MEPPHSSRAWWMSLWQTPQNRMSMTTSRGPGSRRSMASGARAALGFAAAWAGVFIPPVYRKQTKGVALPPPPERNESTVTVLLASPQCQLRFEQRLRRHGRALRLVGLHLRRDVLEGDAGVGGEAREDRQRVGVRV